MRKSFGLIAAVFVLSLVLLLPSAPAVAEEWEWQAFGRGIEVVSATGTTIGYNLFFWNFSQTMSRWMEVQPRFAGEVKEIKILVTERSDKGKFLRVELSITTPKGRVVPAVVSAGEGQRVDAMVYVAHSIVLEALKE